MAEPTEPPPFLDAADAETDAELLNFTRAAAAATGSLAGLVAGFDALRRIAAEGRPGLDRLPSWPAFLAGAGHLRGTIAGLASSIDRYLAAADPDRRGDEH